MGVNHFAFSFSVSEHKIEWDFWLEMATTTLTGRQIPEEHGLGRLWREQGGGKGAITSTNRKLGLAAALPDGSKLWGLLAWSLLHVRKVNCQSQRGTPARVVLRFVLCIGMLLLLMLVGFPPWYGEWDVATHNCLLSGTAVLWTLVGPEISFCIPNKCSYSDRSVYLIITRKVSPKC